MRGLGRLAATPTYISTTTAAAAAKQSLLSSTSSHPFSTFSGDGGGGRGRGRGSGSPPRTPPPSRVPGQTQPEPNPDEDPFAPSGHGHGRGQPVLPSSSALPSFSPFISSLISSSSSGRGRTPHPPPLPDSQPKKPIFFSRGDSAASSEKTQFTDPDENTHLPRSLSPSLSGSGRGKPSRPVDSDARAREENRHSRGRAPIGAPRRGGERTASPSPPRLGPEEARKKAMEVLSGGRGAGEGNRGGRGGRGRGRTTRGRGRGRGGRSRGGRFGDADEEFGLYLGDKADGEKLKKRLGEDIVKKLEEGYEEMSSRVLPSPMEEAYLDALHTNNMIEYEPEYLVELDTNPDIDEKPPIPLRDALEKMKPFLMEYEGIRSQEEWEEIMKETMEKVPHMKELIDIYCGPDRVTAKQQQQELERVAKTLPENIPSSVNRFTDRALLSLQSNPGWGFDKKCQFMDKLVWEVSQHYK